MIQFWWFYDDSYINCVHDHFYFSLIDKEFELKDNRNITSFVCHQCLKENPRWISLFICVLSSLVLQHWSQPPTITPGSVQIQRNVHMSGLSNMFHTLGRSTIIILDNRIKLLYLPFQSWRFDGSADDYCYPDEATNENNGQCKPFNPDAPIYYKIVRCGEFLKIAWHLWYGHQKGCDPFGVDHGHDDDWEHVNINFVHVGDEWQQDSVTFNQHSGHYTRLHIVQWCPKVYYCYQVQHPAPSRCVGGQDRPW